MRKPWVYKRKNIKGFTINAFFVVVSLVPEAPNSIYILPKDSPHIWRSPNGTDGRGE